jgi:Mg-chelatase subunit ChlD
MKRRTAGLVAAACLLAVTARGAQRGPGSPMRILLLVDSSTTMAQMLTPFRAGLLDFLDDLPGDPEIALISTGGQLRIRVPPTADRAKLREAAAAFSSDGGGNSLIDSLIEADRRFLRSAPERRSIVVILTTDSGANPVDARVDAYNRFADAFLKRGGRAHALVVRSVNSGLVTQVAENIAQNTGGYYEMVSIATAVPKLMKSMAVYVAADQ